MFIANLPLYKKLTRLRSNSFASKLNVHLNDNDNVLDFGCGNMYTARELLLLRPDLQITGIDVIRDQNLSNELLADARITFVESSTEVLPFEDGTFDVALALAVMHHTPNPEYYLSELLRVIKPNGSVVLVEEMYHNPLDRIYISAQDWMLNKLKKGVPVPLHFMSNKAYEQLFTKLNLTIAYKGFVRPLPTLMHHYLYKLHKG